MALFKPKKKGDKKDNGSTKRKKETKYVWLISNKAIFLITGDPKESKYSYGIPIIPLFVLFFLSDVDFIVAEPQDDESLPFQFVEVGVLR